MSNEHVLIRASAGTGKTHQLTSRYLRLVADDAAAPEILAATFTRKAAGEILERIVTRLAEACLQERKRVELAQHLSLEVLTPQRCRRLLKSLTSQLHCLRIGTLDSFFAQVAGSFSLELGLPTGWSIADPLHDASLRSEAIETILRDAESSEVARLLNLLAKGDADRSVSELVRSTVNRLYGLFADTHENAWRTFPQLPLLPDAELAVLMEALRTAKLPKHKSIAKAHQTNCEQALSADWMGFVRSGLPSKVRLGENIYYRKEIPAATVAIYEQLIRHARAFLIQQLALQTAATYELLAKFHDVYRRLKHDSRALLFDDITRSLAGGESMRDVERLAFRLDASVSHLLLDEFQDTSGKQWSVLRPLAERTIRPADGGSRAPARSSFFCVGDIKQAIYAWRGGRAEIFGALEKQLPELTLDALTASYRSSQPVIDVVNEVFQGIGRHANLETAEAAVKDWSELFPRHTTVRTDLTGHVQLLTARRADPDDQTPIDAVIEAAADKVEELLAETPGLEIGLLVRRNAVVARTIFELRQRGVRASEEGGNPLTDSAPVQLVLSALRLADHPADTIALMHVANSPLGTALGLPAFPPDANQENNSNNNTENVAEEVAAGLRRRLLQQGYGPVLESWLEQLAECCNTRDLNRLRQLAELGYAYQDTATLRATDFVRHVENQRVADPSAASVRVMNVHQAKGLQFDVVVLADLESSLIGQSPSYVIDQPDPTEPIARVCLYRNKEIQSLLPDDMQTMFQQATHAKVTETVCLLYVAMTRAVHSLYIVISPANVSEKKLPRTSAGLLRAALAGNEPAAPEAVVYEHGDPRWAAAVKWDSAEKQPEQASEQAPLELRFAQPVGKRRGVLGSDSPSNMEGGRLAAAADLLRIDNAQAMARGTLMHAWFEHVLWLNDPPPTRETLVQIARQVGAANLDVEQMIKDFHLLLGARQISEVLSREYYDLVAQPAASATSPTPFSEVFLQRLGGKRLRLDVRNEFPVATWEDNQILSGFVDRLVLLYEDDVVVGADIIDFKTDRIADHDQAALAQRLEHYRPQIEAYRRIVSSMFRLPPECVAARLLFLTPVVVSPLHE